MKKVATDGKKSGGCICCRCNKYKKKDMQISYEHDYMAIPSYTSGHTVTSRSINTFLAHARFAPGIVEIFDSLASTTRFQTSPDINKEDDDGKDFLNEIEDNVDNEVGTMMKIKVEPQYVGRKFSLLFQGLVEKYGCLPVALYRHMEDENNDNILPYIYSAPKWDTLIHNGDSCIVIFPPPPPPPSKDGMVNETTINNAQSNDADRKHYSPKMNKRVDHDQKTNRNNNNFMDGMYSDDDEMLDEKDGRISLKLDESRFSKNPLSAMKLQLAGTSKIDDLKGMDHDEFMKTMMEEYDLNTESLHTDVE